MKKAGYFFYTFLPALLALGIEFLAVFFLTGMAVLVPQITSGGAHSIHIFTILSDTEFLTMTMVVYSMINIAVFGIWYYQRFEGNYLPKPSQTFHPLMLAGIVLLVPGIQFLSIIIMNGLATLFPSWLDAYMELIESAGMDDKLTFLTFCYSVILAPINEELIFRGVTLRSARRVFPFWLANIFQAFLFGAFHMNMIQGCYAFVAGLFLGYLCEMGGSIYCSILLHILFNFWGTVISEHLELGDGILTLILILMLAILPTLAGMKLFRRGILTVRSKNQEYEQEYEQP